jgi:urease accessory protein UreF
MTTRATLAAMHAGRVLEAGRLERAAARRPHDDPDAMQARDQAADARREAAALREALEAMGGAFLHHDPRQLVLLQIPEDVS